LDGLADDGARAGEVGVLVERVLEGGEGFVLVVAVDGDVGDQVVEVGIGWARRAHAGSGSLVGAVRRLG